MKSAPAALLFFVAAASASRAYADPGPCKAWAGPVARAPTSVELAMLRGIVHDVARKEGVDPYALEAIAMVETGFVAAIGEYCEIGYFQIMPRWAEAFRLETPYLFFDPTIGAIAAARLYRHGWERWQDRFVHLGANPCFGGAKGKGKKLDRLIFSALVYNYGRAPLVLASVKNLATVDLPDSACSYARRFATELARARKKGPA